jgi:hypothetical protein
MRADAERLDDLDEEYQRAIAAALHAQTEYSELLETHAEDDPVTQAALFRLWHAQQRQRELQTQLDALHH